MEKEKGFLTSIAESKWAKPATVFLGMTALFGVGAKVMNKVKLPQHIQERIADGYDHKYAGIKKDVLQKLHEAGVDVINQKVELDGHNLIWSILRTPDGKVIELEVGQQVDVIKAQDADTDSISILITNVEKQSPPQIMEIEKGQSVSDWGLGDSEIGKYVTPAEEMAIKQMGGKVSIDGDHMVVKFATPDGFKELAYDLDGLAGVMVNPSSNSDSNIDIMSFQEGGVYDTETLDIGVSDLIGASSQFEQSIVDAQQEGLEIPNYPGYSNNSNAGSGGGRRGF